MATSIYTQLEGNLELGVSAATPSWINVEEFVTSFVINHARNSVTVPATLALAREREFQGSLKQTLTISFFTDMASTSIGRLFEEAVIDADDLVFRGNFNDGATSPSNRKYTGTVSVMGVDVGGDVGNLRMQTITLPILTLTISDS